MPVADFLPAARKIVVAQVAALEAFTIGVCWSAKNLHAPKVETVEAVAARLFAKSEDVK